MNVRFLVMLLIAATSAYIAPTNPAAAFAWGNFAGDDKLSAEARANASEYLVALTQIYGALSKLDRFMQEKN